MIRATAAEVQKQFGYYTEKAQREPVTVTKHGRDSVVLVSTDVFEDMQKAYYAARSFTAWELPDDIAVAIETAEPSAEARALDAELDR